MRADFVVPLLDAVLSSIKTRFSKQATDFMMRILRSHQRIGSVKMTKKIGSFTAAVRCLADYYRLEASVAV